MQAPRFLIALVSLCVVTGISSAQPLVRQTVRSSPAVVAASAQTPAWLADVDARLQEPIKAILKNPTLTTKFEEDEFTAHPKVYGWLLDHPDRAGLAWTRIGVPSVDITDQGKGVFRYTDPQGSDLVWQSVATYSDGRVWYATGKVKPATLVPTVAVNAVAVMKHPSTPTKDGLATYKPTIQVYFQTDSKAATAVMKIVGNAAPRMAEEGAEQLLFFFSGLGRYLNKHPEKVQTLLAPAVVRK